MTSLMIRQVLLEEDEMVGALTRMESKRNEL